MPVSEPSGQKAGRLGGKDKHNVDDKMDADDDKLGDDKSNGKVRDDIFDGDKGGGKVDRDEQGHSGKVDDEKHGYEDDNNIKHNADEEPYHDEGMRSKKMDGPAPALSDQPADYETK